MKERDCTFDIMKGIAMVLVIMSHTPPWAYPSFAYWRSALFFIISGYFAKEWTVGNFLQKGAKRIFIPYVVTCLFMIPFVLLGEKVFDADAISIAVKSMALGAASFGYADKYRDICIGPLWFLWALIWVRILWAFVQKIKNEFIRGMIVVLWGITAYKLREYTINPWSIFSAFGALGFFYCGYLIRFYNLLNSVYGKRIAPFAVVCLVYCICFSKMDINTCMYESGYIVELVGSIGAFMLLYASVRYFYDCSTCFWNFLNFFGRYSLVAFCFHSVDFCLCSCWLPFKFWDLFATNFELCCAIVLRVGIAALGCYLVSKNKFLKERIFFIKD